MRRVSIARGCVNTFLFDTHDDVGGWSPNFLTSVIGIKIELSIIRSHFREQKNKFSLFREKPKNKTNRI